MVSWRSTDGEEDVVVYVDDDSVTVAYRNRKTGESGIWKTSTSSYQDTDESVLLGEYGLRAFRTYVGQKYGTFMYNIVDGIETLVNTRILFPLFSWLTEKGHPAPERILMKIYLGFGRLLYYLFTERGYKIGNVGYELVKDMN